MKSLVLLAALLLVGCSVEVSHQSDNENHSEESSTVERSQTSVGVGFLNDPTPPHKPKVPNAKHCPSTERSQTTVKVIRSLKVEKTPTTITQSPDQSTACTPTDLVSQVQI